MLTKLLDFLEKLDLDIIMPAVVKTEMKVAGFSRNEPRPDWDHVWVDFACSISRRSYDPRHQVGAVVVAEDNTQVLAIGYNGNYAGGPNEVESKLPGQSGMIHAEINALLKMDYNNPKRKKMYITMSPCRMCAKAIVNAGINEVFYAVKYRDTSGLKILKDACIKTKHLPV